MIGGTTMQQFSTFVVRSFETARTRVLYRQLTVVAVMALVCNLQAVASETWAEKLGWPKDAKLLILHADDIGMCYEANQAAKNYFEQGHIQSAALMVPCPWYNEAAAWFTQHPKLDVGLHLTLTSEWKWYRWRPVTDPSKVPGLMDAEGYLHRGVLGVARSASAKEVELELRAQIEKAIKAGPRPSHIDTHMGTLYARPDYAKVYLALAEEYRIPAMAIAMTEGNVEKFRQQGYPVNDELLKVVSEYTLPKLDDFHAVPEGATYDEKLNRFFEQVRSMRPGLNEVIFHPSIATQGLRKITNSWQQRVWEAKMFSDPVVLRFFDSEGIKFTNWIEIMQRFEKRN